MQKTTDFGLVVLCVYEYSDIKIVERVERFSSETTTYWLRVPHFDFEAITEKYNDTNVVFVKSFAASVEQVLALRDIAVRQGAYQRKHV